MRLRLLTWNLQGGRRPDLDAVGAVLDEHDPDVVVLQEVQRRQARALAARRGWSWTWRFKHWPVVRPAEGQAVLSRLPLRDPAAIAIGARWAWCWWRRRIVVVAAVPVDDHVVHVANVHLGTVAEGQERVRQLRRMLRGIDRRVPLVVAGDLNAEPGSPVLGLLHEVQFDDAPASPAEDRRGPTNWTAGPRQEAPPTQWLDHVLAGPGLRIARVGVPRFGEAGFERYPPLSDHLPVVAELMWDDAGYPPLT